MTVLNYLIWIEAIILLLMIATRKRFIAYDVEENGVIEEYNSRFFIALFVLAMFIVSAYRNNFIDTADYRGMYERIGTTFSNVFNNVIPDVEKGWLLFTYLLNRISTNSQFLLQVTSAIVLISSIYFLSKKSSNLAFSCWIYLCLEFVNTMNGIRQTMAGAIVALIWMIWEKRERKISNDILFILSIIVVSTIHQSAIVCIIVFFCARGKLLNKWMKGIVAVSLLMFIVPRIYYGVLENILGGSSYSQYIAESAVMGVMRFLVKMVPVILIILYRLNFKREEIEQPYSWMMNISIFNACCSLLALRMVYFARIGMYFNLFDIVLIPWLVDRCFTPRTATMIKVIAFILYGYFYFYQLNAFGGYISNFRLIFAN